MHTAVSINTFDNGDMSEISGALNVGLQDNDRWDMRGRGNVPSGSPGAICPLICIAEPGNPVTCQIVIFIVGPEGTLTISEPIGSTRACNNGSSIGLIVSILAYKCRCRCRLLCDKVGVRVALIVRYMIDPDLEWVEAETIACC